MIDTPAYASVELREGVDSIFHWGIDCHEAQIAFQLESDTRNWNLSIFPGPPQFEADQISRLLEIKMPRLAKAHKNHAPLCFNNESG
jgi:hypothetical protein